MKKYLCLTVLGALSAFSSSAQAQNCHPGFVSPCPGVYVAGCGSSSFLPQLPPPPRYRFNTVYVPQTVIQAEYPEPYIENRTRTWTENYQVRGWRFRD